MRKALDGGDLAAFESIQLSRPLKRRCCRIHRLALDFDRRGSLNAEHDVNILSVGFLQSNPPATARGINLFNLLAVRFRKQVEICAAAGMKSETKKVSRTLFNYVTVRSGIGRSEEASMRFG